ncbi:hypothetical protein OM076_44320 [Solirubrobacter ginsenosidimutans]|uniref:Htaa domain-containing protein n=1 Tax=Solirubrobacter ginsenosidimutans TaxID=490573 RepID=A0A9X3N342_9ACTN|nr:hypothetical protein [Solirubrobacter ginsenosidimutans]MDA0167367.1 hypothetical protein [Solirubrobacter ginsenosidimutans]
MHGRVSLATLAAALLLAAPASAALPAGNLVVNPGAEAAPGATDSGTQVALPGWTVTGSLTAVAYGTPAFLTAEDAARLGGGANFFAGGPDGNSNTASQLINVSGAAPEIAKGVTGTLSALIGGYASQDDSATVSAQPLDAAGTPIAPATVLPAVTSADRKGLTDLLPRTATVSIPLDTRLIAVTITTTRTAGQYNDGYVDNVSFSFGGSPVAGKSVGARPVSGTVLVRVPGSSKFASLDASVIKNGTEVDARRGVVEITRSDGGVAKFYDGIFKLSQSGGITTLTLSEKLDCSKRALAAAAKPKTRRLWGDGKGKFRTKGQYSAATVRGTKWLVTDTCTTTVTRVAQGTVSVRDVRLKKTVIVRPGKPYTARAKRR